MGLTYGLKFVNLYIDGVLTGSQLVQFSRRNTFALRTPPEVLVGNDDNIVFPISRKTKGEPSINIQGAVLEMSTNYVKMRAGDTLTIAPGQLTVTVVS